MTRKALHVICVAILLATVFACGDTSREDPDGSIEEPDAGVDPDGGEVGGDGPARFGITAVGSTFDCDIMRSLGAGATWGPLYWPWVEPSQDEWQFDGLDAILSQVEACGTEVGLKLHADQEHWGVLPVENPEDSVPNNQLKVGSRPPVRLEDFYDWIHHVAERYRGRIRWYAIENEVTARSFFLGTYDEYEAMWETGRRAIRDADPDALVVDFGMPSESYGIAIAHWRLDNGDPEGAIAFLNRYYERRNKPEVHSEAELEVALGDPDHQRNYEIMLRHFQRPELYDAYQLHYYEPWDLLPEVLAWIRARMAENGPVQPIVGWEIGYADVDTDEYDPELHGRETTKVMVTALGEGVESTYYLPYTSQLARDGHDEVWWALVDGSGDPRPALGAYQQAARTIDRFSTARRLSLGPETWSWCFDSVQIGWTMTGDPTFGACPADEL